MTPPVPPSGNARDDQQWRVAKRRLLTLGGNAANVAVGLAATSLAVTFPKVEPDTKYGVLVTPSWLTGVSVSGKSTTGFTANFSTGAPANATVDWSVFRSEATTPIAQAGGGGGITATATPDDASLVQAQHVYRTVQRIPDVRAGANITVTPDAQGYVVAGTGGGLPADDSSLVQAQHVFRHPNPLYPGVSGTFKSVTTNTEGRVVAGTNPTTLAGYGITDAAPIGSAFVTVGNDATLTNERALSAAGAITVTDGGANGPVTVGIILEDSSLVQSQHVFRAGAPPITASVVTAVREPGLPMARLASAAAAFQFVDAGPGSSLTGQVLIDDVSLHLSQVVFGAY